MSIGLTNLRRLSPVAQLGAILVGKSSPTASLYFENACSDWIADGRVQKISSTVFASEKTQIIFRHDAGVPVGFSRSNTVYFMDDYWLRDPELPWQYRQKAKLVEQRAAHFFMTRADNIGVSSATLRRFALSQFPTAKIGVLQPYWSESMANLDHFGQKGLEVCYLGAKSHAKDLQLIIPAVRDLLQQFPEARFTVSTQHSLPKDLSNHPQIKYVQKMSWEEYRLAILTLKFHIALYPMRPSAFNRCRSVNKLIEHAVVGAATLASRGWFEGSDRIIQVGGTSQDWTEKLIKVAAQKPMLHEVAQSNRAAILIENNRETQRAFWQKLLFPT